MIPAGLLPIDIGDAVLEATVAQDAEAAYVVVDVERDRLAEWLPWVHATTSVRVERDYLDSVDEANRAGDGLHLTIWHGGAFAGFVGLRVDPRHAAGEVGYWLASWACGRGLMVRSVAAVLDLAFGPFALHRVQLLAATGNTRSRAVAERLGMAHEGTRREAELLPAGFVDLEAYSMLVREWPGAVAAVSGTGPGSGDSGR